MMVKHTPVRVLVVEDDFLVALAIWALVREAGEEVVADAADAQEAIDLVVRLHPDVVLMDIGMPGVDGFTATRRIQAAAPTPVVILSAYHRTTKRMQAARLAGAGGYLVKMPDAAELDRTIRRAIVSFRLGGRPVRRSRASFRVRPRRRRLPAGQSNWTRPKRWRSGTGTMGRSRERRK